MNLEEQDQLYDLTLSGGQIAFLCERLQEATKDMTMDELFLSMQMIEYFTFIIKATRDEDIDLNVMVEREMNRRKQERNELEE